MIVILSATGESKNRDIGYTDLEIPAYHPFVDPDPDPGASASASGSRD